MLDRACILTVQDAGVFYSKMQFSRALRSKLGSCIVTEGSGQTNMSAGHFPLLPTLWYQFSRLGSKRERSSVPARAGHPAQHGGAAGNAPPRALHRLQPCSRETGKGLGPDRPSARAQAGEKEGKPQGKSIRRKLLLRRRSSWAQLVNAVCI